MDEAKKVLIQSWLIKAQHDPASAQRLAAGDDSLLDTAVYHCQQAAEKAIKEFLVYHDTRFEKTHDLVVLATETSPFTQDFASLGVQSSRLTRYATMFRYPEAQMEPTRAEYEQAYQDAAQFVSVTLALIPTEARPPS